MRGRFVFCPPQSVDRRGFLRDALAQTSELGGVTTESTTYYTADHLHRPLSSEGLRPSVWAGSPARRLAQTSELGGVTTDQQPHTL